MASVYTPNYNLDKYVGTDKPNLRDQYNSAMDKIDAQFVVIENDHTETGNQISAINTNIGQLGTRITEVKGDVANAKTTADNALSLASTNKTTADKALSLASTNKTDIATLDGEMAQVKQGVQDLQGLTMSQVLLDSAGKTTAQAMWTLHEPNAKAVYKDIEMLAPVPDWANWLDVYIDSPDLYFGAGSVSGSITSVEFVSPIQVVTFPLNEYYVSAGKVTVRRANKFSIVLNGQLSTMYDGTSSFIHGHYPFMINGTTITQNNLGIAYPTSTSEHLYNNARASWGLKYDESDNPAFNHTAARAVVRKIVARA